MRETTRAADRKAAAEYWDEHSFDEILPGDEEVEIEVKRPLSAVISVRMDPGHVEKLRRLARSQSIGMTTMARRIIEQTLDQPGGHSDRQALNHPRLRETVEGMLAESRTPYETGDAAYHILSNEGIEYVARLVQDAAARLVVEAFREKSIAVAHDAGDIYERLRQLEQTSD